MHYHMDMDLDCSEQDFAGPLQSTPTLHPESSDSSHTIAPPIPDVIVPDKLVASSSSSYVWVTLASSSSSSLSSSTNSLPQDSSNNNDISSKVDMMDLDEDLSLNKGHTFRAMTSLHDSTPGSVNDENEDEAKITQPESIAATLQHRALEQKQEQEQEQEQETALAEAKTEAETEPGPMDHSQRQYPAIPSELILYIFKFLAAPQDLRSAILVCKLWCSCGMDLLWNRPALLSLSLVHKMCSTIALDRSETVFPYADYIRRLNFSFLAQDLTDDVLTQFDCCTRLERLLLPGCSKATEEGLKQILEVGQGLYSLDLSDIPAVTDAVLEHIAEYCPKLHTLYLTGCAALTDDSLIKLASRCLSLKRIKLSQCVLLTDRSILALTKNCPQLMEIDVTNCTLMTNSAIQSVFVTLPQIRDINMTSLANLTDQAFASIPFGSSPSSLTLPASLATPTIRFEQLRVLNLTSCIHITDETLSRIIPAAPRLRSLALTKCDRITDVGASVIKILGKHLHYLHLGHCSKLTDKAIATLTQHCTRIRYLDLACCSKLTDAAVFAMAQLPKLRRIGLVKCSNITDHGIYAMLVSQIVPQTLERVHLSYCVHLSDTAVSALVSQCAKLTHLSVTGVPAFMSPRYQKFCRVPPSEFTAHQREVFCVFSGKGVRELRQFMQDHPTMPSSTLSSIQRSYRIMGSTVAQMVAGGHQSATIMAHLGLTLRETESHVHSLAVQSAAASSNNEGSGSGSGSAIGSVDASMLSEAGISTATLSQTAEQQLLQQENDALEMEQQMEVLEQAENDYAEMMMQQHHLLHRHHHRQHRHHNHHHHQGHQSRHRFHMQYDEDSASSSGAEAAAGPSISTSNALTSRAVLTDAGQGSPSLFVAETTASHAHVLMSPFYSAQSQQPFRPIRLDLESMEQDDDDSAIETSTLLHQLQGETDVRMATPVSAEQERVHKTQDEIRVEGVGEGEGEGEGAEGSSGGSGHGSPTEEEDEDGEEDDLEVDDDVFGGDDHQDERSSRPRQ